MEKDERAQLKLRESLSKIWEKCHSFKYIELTTRGCRILLGFTTIICLLAH